MKHKVNRRKEITKIMEIDKIETKTPRENVNKTKFIF